MNQNTIMQTPVQDPSASKTMKRVGVGITGLAVLFLGFDGITKVIRVAPVMEACQELGISPNTAVGIGLLLLGCTVLYAIPRTAVFGAVLLTAYLGGAVATHVIQKSGTFPTGFAIGFGVLVWVGLVLREPRLIRLIFLRQ